MKPESFPNDQFWSEVAAYFWRECGRDAEWFGRQTYRNVMWYLETLKPKQTFTTLASAIESCKKRRRAGSGYGW